MSHSKMTPILAQWAGVLLASAILGQSAWASDDLIELQKDPAQWTMQQQNYANTRYSPLKQIDTSNVQNLKVAWQFSTGVLRGHEGGPLVVGDMMYVHTPFPTKIFAIDLNDPGKIVWIYDGKPDRESMAVACCDVVNRGPSYADGKLFLSLLDGHLVAINAKTGKEVWRVQDADFKTGATSTMSPVVIGNAVFIGNSGGEYGVRGHMTAYDIKDGHKLWRAWSTGPDTDVLIDPATTLMMGKPVGESDLGVKTWPGDQWKLGGGTTWGWISYDPSLDLMYYGTGNPGVWDPTVRPGDNKWSMTLFARNPKTGMAKWAYQMTPHDEWDYDGINENVLIDREIDGAARKLLVHFDRNGFAYTIDRETGVPLVAEKFDPTVNWASSVDLKTGLPVRVKKFSTDAGGEGNVTKGICPASVGAKDEQPVSYSEETGLIYAPTNHLCMEYQPFQVSYVAGQPYVGAIVNMFAAGPGDDLGRFIAWDPVKGKTVWETPERFAPWGGVLSTAGGLVFYGTMDRFAKAVDAKTGKLLWQAQTPSGIIGNFMTFEHKGKQYVAVYSGIGGWAALGLAAGLTEPTEGLGVVGAFAHLNEYTQLGGVLTVWSLPSNP